MAVRIPKTDIHCPMCLGDGKDHSPGGHLPTCGHCQGCGLSIHPYDQPRNGTTSGVDVPGNMPFPPSRADLKRLFEAGGLQNVEILSDGFQTYKQERNWSGVLIAWDNLDYPERLAKFKAGELYAVSYWEGAR